MLEGGAQPNPAKVLQCACPMFMGGKGMGEELSPCTRVSVMFPFFNFPRIGPCENNPHKNGD